MKILQKIPINNLFDKINMENQIEWSEMAAVAILKIENRLQLWKYLIIIMQFCQERSIKSLHACKNGVQILEFHIPRWRQQPPWKLKTGCYFQAYGPAIIGFLKALPIIIWNQIVGLYEDDHSCRLPNHKVICHMLKVLIHHCSVCCLENRSMLKKLSA
jgi:hypothetical protein